MSKTIQDLRTEFKSETGKNYSSSKNADKIEWLEEKVLTLQNENFAINSLFNGK